MPDLLPTIGHVLQYGFPYSPTALQAARQLQLTLAEAGARQAAYANRAGEVELAAPAALGASAPLAWGAWRRTWSANYRIFAQRERWRREDALIVYDAAHFPAVYAHPATLFFVAGPHGNPGSRRVRERFRRFLIQLAWKRSACVAVSETRWLRAFGIDARAGEFRFRGARPGVWHIPPYVDSDLFHPDRALERFRAMQSVVYFGELTEGAGFHLAAETFRRFAARHGEATFLILGGPARPRGAGAALSALERPGLAGRAMLLGDLPEAALPEILASARMVLLPLIEERDAKIAALQSMAGGAPTLSTSIGGLDDLPTVKFEPTIEGLLQAMESVWSDPGDTGGRQRDQVRAQFALANWEEAWLDVLGWLRRKTRGEM